MRARPRIQDAGLIYHVTSRGTRRAEIYRSDADRHHFLRFVDRACGVDGLICHAYCLMGNHYHLLVEAPAGNLAVAMHRINSGFAKHFNLEHNVEGHSSNAATDRGSWEVRRARWRHCGTSSAIRCERAFVRLPRSGHGRAMQRPPASRLARTSSPSVPCTAGSAPRPWRQQRTIGLSWTPGSTRLSSDRPLRNSSIEALSMKSRRRMKRTATRCGRSHNSSAFRRPHSAEGYEQAAVKHWHQAAMFQAPGLLSREAVLDRRSAAGEVCRGVRRELERDPEPFRGLRGQASQRPWRSSGGQGAPADDLGHAAGAEERLVPWPAVHAVEQRSTRMRSPERASRSSAELRVTSTARAIAPSAPLPRFSSVAVRATTSPAARSAASASSPSVPDMATWREPAGPPFGARRGHTPPRRRKTPSAANTTNERAAARTRRPRVGPSLAHRAPSLEHVRAMARVPRDRRRPRELRANG